MRGRRENERHNEENEGKRAEIGISQNRKSLQILSFPKETQGKKERKFIGFPDL